MNQVDRGYFVELRWPWCHLQATNFEDYLHLSIPSNVLFETDYWSHCLHARKTALFVREIQYFERSARMRSQALPVSQTSRLLTEPFRKLEPSNLMEGASL
jgi:hypothetical protein